MKTPFNMKPKVHLLACGGTIASVSAKNTDEFYSSPTVDIRDLVTQIHSVDDTAEVKCEQYEQIASHKMTNIDLINLAKKVDSILVKDDINGVVITQGTNSIEEVAYFLSLVVSTKKPIVFTGAMRASNSLGADGLRNLYNSILLASSKKAENIGVILTFNDVINNARDSSKQNPSSINGLSLNDESIIGYIHGNYIDIRKIPTGKHTYQSEFNIDNISSLAKVYVIFGHLDSDGIFVDAAIANGADGIISVGMGKGYQSLATTEALIRAAEKGLTIVRCTRTGNGFVNRDAKLDDKYGFIAGGSLSPQKARILLSVALCHTQNKEKIQNYFYDY